MTTTTAQQVLTEKGIDRRRHKRYKTTGKVMTQLINPKGETIGKPFRGHLDDISAHGTSYLIKTSQQETARLLLGRRAGIHIYGAGQETPHFKTNGLIVAVHSLMHNDYSVHIKFDSVLSETDVTNFASQGKKS